MLALIMVMPAWAGGRTERDTLGSGARICFSENRGQWEPQVLFRSMMHGATLFVERDCFTFVVQHRDNENLHHPPMASDGKGRYRQHAYRIRFEGCTTATVEGTERDDGVEHYYIGRDRSRWASNVGTYQSVVYRQLYPQVDMKVYAASKALKYDFIVYPGGRADAIEMRYEGTDGLRLKNGNLEVRTSVADIVELRPYAYQMVDGRQVEVASRYRLEGDKIRFEVGPYDSSQVLIIDPYLHFSTYTGSTADNWGTTGCFDEYRNTYTAGVVFGTGYPVSLGAYDGSYNGNCDIGIFKFDSSGQQRLYATYLGGSMADMPHSMFVNTMNELVVFGTTGSGNFPVSANAYDTSFNGGTSLQYEGSTTINFPNGSDLFICRFNSDGSQLQASTYVGGSGNDGLNYRNSFDYATIMMGNDSLYFNYGDGARGEIITDQQNNIYVGSTTTSADFPVTAGCIQPTGGGGQDGVVFKIDYNLRNIMWSTYLGGNHDDAIYSVDCDKDYNVIVCGGTNSTNFPTTPGCYKPNYGGGSADGFVAKISYYGNTLMGSTHFGSTAYDQCYFVRCGKQDDIFLFGQTKAYGSTLIHNANYGTPNSGQFLARFSSGLDSLVWSTVVGDGSGEPNISPTAFTADICNRLYLSGWGRLFLGRTFNGTSYAWNTHGTSNLTVTSDAYQSVTDGQDFYIMAVDIDASQLVYATYFGEQHNSNNYYSGGDHVDGGTSRFDRHGTLYQSVCASCSGGDDFPITVGAYGQHNNSSNCNNAIFRLNLSSDFPVAEFLIPPTVCLSGNNVELVNTGRGTNYLWLFDDGTSYPTNSTLPFNHTFTTPGLHQITLIAYMPGACSNSDTMTRNIMVLGNSSYPLDTLSTCPGIPLQIGIAPTLSCTYQWIGGHVSDSTIANPTVTQTGTYILVVTTTDGQCSDTLTQVVKIGEADATIVGDTVSCDSPTLLSVNAPGMNNSYQWSSNAAMTDTLNNDMSTPFYSFTPTGAQWLYLRVVDDLGCVKDDSIHIRFDNIIDTFDIFDPRCPYDHWGQLHVTFSDAGTPPYRWSINGGPWSDMGSPGELFGWTPAPAGTPGRLNISDANGCDVELDFTIAEKPYPIIDTTVNHIACLESCTGSITVNVSGPSTYSLLWLDDSSTTATRSDLCPGRYILEVTDSSGCQFYDTIEVLENYNMHLTVSDAHNSCPNLCSGSATATASGGTAPYTYTWSNGETESTAHQLCEGTTVVVATDADGCEVRDSIAIDVQHSFDAIDAWADDEVIFGGHSTGLHVTTIPNGSYYWSPSDKVDDASSPNPTATLDDTTMFIVTVTDSIGCTMDDTVVVKCVNVVCGKPNIFIPNAFTPNNDGKNDQLCFSGDWVQEFHIAIFTRWGEKVYESDDMNACWDGRFRNNWCMPGVYVYHCRITCQDGQTGQFKGDITLIR